mmetsp:Transcript_82299/g.142609  ORF Transcript_82299/g.142609 Transcript_82299/m.142609 type:complete len:498 (+) Transcript_82299:44-1537(+)
MRRQHDSFFPMSLGKWPRVLLRRCCWSMPLPRLLDLKTCRVAVIVNLALCALASSWLFSRLLGVRKQASVEQTEALDDIMRWKVVLPRRVLIDTPPHTVLWNGDLARRSGGNVGISGSHTAFLPVAEYFAQEGWLTYVSGSVAPTERSGVEHRRPVYIHWTSEHFKSEVCPDGLVDVVITTSMFYTYDKCSTRLLIIVMAMQGLIHADELWRYVRKQHTTVFGFKVAFLHLSHWGENVFRKLYPENWLRLGLAQGWVKHEAALFRNPVDVRGIVEAVQRSSSRNEHSMIFHACIDRGGAVAAKVYARMSQVWGADASGLWCTYTYDGPDVHLEKRAVEEAVHGHRGARVLEHGLSKPNLYAELATSGFFVYGCASRKSLVHYDTFALVVAEALAAGVLVLAPPLAALPELYKDVVTWVEPSGGLRETTREAFGSVQDKSLSDDSMIKGYADAIAALMANTTRRSELRARGLQLVREEFSAERISSALYRYVVANLAD